MTQNKKEEILNNEVKEAREFIEKIQNEYAERDAKTRQCVAALRLSGESRFWVTMRLKPQYALTLLQEAARIWQEYLREEKNPISQMSRGAELDHVIRRANLCKEIAHSAQPPLCSIEETKAFNEEQKRILGAVGDQVLSTQEYLEILRQPKPKRSGCHWNMIIIARDNRVIDLDNASVPSWLQEKAKKLLDEFNLAREAGQYNLGEEINYTEEKLNIEKGLFLFLVKEYLEKQKRLPE